MSSTPCIVKSQAAALWCRCIVILYSAGYVMDSAPLGPSDFCANDTPAEAAASSSKGKGNPPAPPPPSGKGKVADDSSSPSAGKGYGKAKGPPLTKGNYRAHLLTTRSHCGFTHHSLRKSKIWNGRECCPTPTPQHPVESSCQYMFNPLICPSLRTQ